MKTKFNVALEILIMLACISSVRAQQRGEYVPGQYGLNAGIIPDPGFTAGNLTLNYSANTLKDSNGNTVLRGSYSLWSIEQIFYYVPAAKVFGGHLQLMAMLPAANGSLTVPTFGLAGGAYGYSDTWIQPVTLGWHLKRADTWLGYAFIAPTGSFFPGSSNNTGTGYWGNNVASGTTVYLTKNKGTSLNLATNWEIHGRKRGTTETPGQAFTDEWGLGQILPLDKKFTKLLQLGIIGFDQWQVTANTGNAAPGVPAGPLPFYSVHAVGVQTNFILPGKGGAFFFKYEPEYLARATTAGRTIVFGLSWTIRDPKPKAPQP